MSNLRERTKLQLEEERGQGQYEAMRNQKKKCPLRTNMEEEQGGEKR